MVVTDIGEREFGRMLMPKPLSAANPFMGWRTPTPDVIGSGDSVPSNIKPLKKDSIPGLLASNDTKTKSVILGFVQIIFEFITTNAGVFNYYTQYLSIFENTSDTPGSETQFMLSFDLIEPMTHIEGTRIIHNLFLDRR